MSTFANRLATRITNLGLAGPAVLLLEANKPLAFLGSQLLLVAQPTLNLFLARDFTQNVVDLLADSEQLEQLIDRLEEKPGPASGDKALPQTGQAIMPDVNFSSEETQL
ncbi:MAG: hypothetical protein JW953_19590 [Anaerolineae bacterium]|nr:hypothetical protein [Anaerolineae bacterium]